MRKAARISEIAKALGITPHYLRVLEYQGSIPAARRDFNGRVYPEFDLALLRALGVGVRPRKLKRGKEVLGQVR